MRDNKKITVKISHTEGKVRKLKVPVYQYSDSEKWFLNRKKKILNYQIDAIDKVWQSIIDRKITVLAAAPSAGKTIMSIYIAEKFLNERPDAKVLILAHGTTILRTQYHDVLKETKPDFRFAVAESYKEYQELVNHVNVIVTLPQSIRKAELQSIDLLIVDEAHHRYFAKEVKNIIKACQPKKQLLLTGTPSKFILHKYHIIPVSLNTVYDAGMISDFNVHIASSNYNFNLNDYNSYGDLMLSDNKFLKKDTDKTLDELIKKIVEYLKSIKNYAFVNFVPEWLPTLKQLKKTMIACKSQHQAKQVQKYFEKIGVKAVMSISDTDLSSIEIEKFKQDDDILVLIVVGRGILGFNMPELINIVDMTTSYNIDRIYQLLCRVARKHPKGDKKLFFKIAPQMLTDYYQHIMTATCMLTDEKFFTTFNGKNFRDMEIPVKKVRAANKPNKSDNKGSRSKKYIPIDMEGLPVFEFFKTIYHKKGELLHTYAMTSINDIRVEFMNRMPMGYWTLERCKEIALKYKFIVDWIKNDGSSYNAACKNGWLKECTKHMKNRRIAQSKEECRYEASLCKKATEWRNRFNASFLTARRNGWYEELSSHMPKAYKISKQQCLDAAADCNSPVEFRKKYPSIRQISQRRGWYEECLKIIDKNKNKNKDDDFFWELI